MQIYISRNRDQLGPYDLDAINAGLASGSFRPDDLAWHEGATGWAPLASLPGVAQPVRPPALPPSPPPPPPSPPPPPPHSSMGTSASPPQPRGRSLASRGARLGASMIDGLMFCGVVLLPGALGWIIGLAEGGDPDNGMYSGIAFGFVGLAAWMIANTVLLVRHGQTYGKRMIGVRIVNVTDGRVPEWIHSILLRSVVSGVLGAIPYFGWLYIIVDSCFIFREDRRCVHDLMAGTEVVFVER